MQKINSRLVCLITTVVQWCWSKLTMALLRLWCWSRFQTAATHRHSLHEDCSSTHTCEIDYVWLSLFGDR